MAKGKAGRAKAARASKAVTGAKAATGATKAKTTSAISSATTSATWATLANSATSANSAVVASLNVWPPEHDEDGAFFKQRLSRVHLLPELIFAVPNALSAEECASWVAFGEARGFEDAKHKASAEFAHRDNGRIAVHSPDVAARLFRRISLFVPDTIDGKVPVACSSNVRLYRYGPGQRFGKHVDESSWDEAAEAESLFTLLFYLNSGDGLAGGDTVFYAGETGAVEVLRVQPEAGLALLHHHGDKCLLHEGAIVRTGVKYLLRTDVLYANPSVRCLS